MITFLNALAIRLGLKTSYRVYDTYPSFEKCGEWEPHGTFKEVQQRRVHVKLECCQHTYTQLRRKPLVLTVPKLPEFDWLKDYGPMWEPASTAFWLAPETELEILEWYRKYRPKEFDIIYGYGPRYSSYQNNSMGGYQNMLPSQYSQNRNMGLFGNIF